MKVEVNKETIETNRPIVVYDDKGNRYRITSDRFGGIEVMVEDGHMSIEPHVSNEITIKTIE